MNPFEQRLTDGDPAGVKHEQYEGPYDPAAYDDSEEKIAQLPDDEFDPDIELPPDADDPDDA